MTSLGSIGAALWTYLPFAIIVALTALVAWLVSLLVLRLSRQSSPQMSRAARQLSVVVVAIVGGTLALEQLGLNVDVLLLIIGLLGATALVALREPLANYGAKYFSDIYTPFKVGDTIAVRGVSGKVIEINPMTTVLLSEDDQLISVPNEAMIQDIVVNTSPQAWKELTIPVSIGGNVDLPAFESDLLKSLGKLRMRLDPRFPPVVTTKSRTLQSTDLVVTLMLRRPEDRDAITLEANKRLTELTDRARGTRR